MGKKFAIAIIIIILSNSLPAIGQGKETIDDIGVERQQPQKVTRGLTKREFLNAIENNSPGLMDKMTDHRKVEEVDKLMLAILKQEGIEIPKDDNTNTCHYSFLNNNLGLIVHSLSKYKLDPNKDKSKYWQNDFKNGLRNIETRCVNNMGRPLPIVAEIKNFLNDYLESLNILLVRLEDEKIDQEKERVAADAKRYEEEKKQRAIQEEKRAQIEKERKVIDAKRQEDFNKMHEDMQKKAKIEKEKEVAREQAQRKEKEDYIAKLKAGKKPIESLSDAIVYHDADENMMVILQPPVSPTNKYHSVYGAIETVESEKYLIARYGSGKDTNYFAIKITRKTIIPNKDEIRIGKMIRIVGKHTSLRKYTTVLGAQRVMPEFEAVWVEGM